MTGPVDPGVLRMRLEFLVLVEAPDGQGGFATEWVKQFDVWASLRPAGASNSERASTRHSVTSYEVVLRKRDGVAPGHRFRLGARLFEIDTAYDPDETGRYLVCRCRELQ
ncbi:MAG: phage head closure protein [Pseudomonadota bacterium]|nr:phage head closure protein [Pseudomonadota bacterium]